jgi:hypothetical protein
MYLLIKSLLLGHFCGQDKGDVGRKHDVKFDLSIFGESAFGISRQKKTAVSLFVGTAVRAVCIFHNKWWL